MGAEAIEPRATIVVFRLVDEPRRGVHRDGLVREPSHVPYRFGPDRFVRVGGNLEHIPVGRRPAAPRSEGRFLARQPTAPRRRPPRAVDHRPPRAHEIPQEDRTPVRLDPDLQRRRPPTRQRIVRQFGGDERNRDAGGILIFVVSHQADDIVAHREEPHSIVRAGRGPTVRHRTALHAEDGVGEPLGEGEFRTRGAQRSVSGGPARRPAHGRGSGSGTRGETRERRRERRGPRPPAGATYEISSVDLAQRFLRDACGGTRGMLRGMGSGRGRGLPDGAPD